MTEPTAQGPEPSGPSHKTEVTPVQPTQQTRNVRVAIKDWVIPILCGGAAGYFGAMFMLQKDVDKLSDRVTKLETKAQIVWTPNGEKLTKLVDKVDDYENRLSNLELKNHADALLRERLQQIREETRKQTTSEVRELVEKLIQELSAEQK